MTAVKFGGVGICCLCMVCQPHASTQLVAWQCGSWVNASYEESMPTAIRIVFLKRKEVILASLRCHHRQAWIFYENLPYAGSIAYNPSGSFD